MSTPIGQLPPATITSFGAENIICDDTEIRGATISFGNNNIVHPKSKIMSVGGGAISFGNYNIIEEGVVIINRTTEVLHIGNDNTFEVGSRFEGLSLGNGCVVEPKASILPGTTVGDNCVIGTSCTTWQNDVLESNSVIFGSNNERRKQTPRSKEQSSVHMKHVEYLKDVLKKFHAQKGGVVQAIGIVS
ncbi:trimeric LpxA-like protein [Obelidium mucronatum]|nr:trimeric LpxA-like protein [Obelidium mucronatum]